MTNCVHCGKPLRNSLLMNGKLGKPKDYFYENNIPWLAENGFTEKDLDSSDVLHCETCHGKRTNSCVYLMMPQGILINRTEGFTWKKVLTLTPPKRKVATSRLIGDVIIQ